MKYYRVLDDLYFPNRWFLKSLNIVDNNKISIWDFVSAKKLDGLDKMDVKISLRSKGIPIDMTFADFDLIVANEKVVSIIDCEFIQLFPLDIVGVKTKHKYYIVNLLDSIDCLDENKSVFEKFTIDDPIRPDKAGQYSSISKLYIDSQKVDLKSNIFRLGKSNDIIVISEILKKKFEFNGISGITFLPITD